MVIKTWKPHEVAVGGVDGCVVADEGGGDVRVNYKIASRRARSGEQLDNGTETALTFQK